MNDFDIVIVNWNSGSQLRDCLLSIPPACSALVHPLRHCIVVDNASTDGSADALETSALPFSVIRNQENKGFAYACNQGAKACNSEYILFLNPDLRLLPGSLVKALPFFEEQGHENIGILGIQLKDGNGVVQRNVARFPTPGSLFSQMLGLDRLWPGRFPSHFLTGWDHGHDREVDQVQGAFFLVRRKVFEQLNGFDERFFMYFEDLDFAYRAEQAGWKSFYLAQAQAIHYGGGASYQVKGKRLYYVFNSRALYVAKHFGFSSALSIVIASYMVEFFARTGWSLVNRSGNNYIETIQAYQMYLRSFPQQLKKMRGK
jgi:N-acetylglucosaminyl-diphospho-decaprenol L-rhamnosyltransferase